ncbi:Sin3 associated polypeptide p18-domain-containing protein [Kockovaella imperatae]|uniref:Sin3 associated polypeptide p18-domain-containing protein n=1 Tax=Kockovaella imperatae TaxID=4999 RepID=A0A1Y1U8W5_9TREE|nr:Sin3 associated polypeptide p18-domain-containing protein [Kockovaella imperatae]ORX33927.1 Sin3 associated polypeptide p18-domain-containing protein [Kockovaella imperatae]
MARSRSPSGSRSRSPVKRRAGSADVETAGDIEASGCPFLIRLFLSKGRHAPMIDFDDGKFPIRDEFQVYGWKTSTPTSLIALVYANLPPPYRSPLARFSFRHIYVDASARGLYKSNDLVSFTGRDLSATLEEKPESKGMDMELDQTIDSGGPGARRGRKVDEKTLDGYGFVTGDLLSVCVNVPEPKLHPGPNRPPLMGLSNGAGAGGPGDRIGGGFGRPDKFNGREGGREVHPSDKEGTWSRGEALPPAGRPIRGSAGRELLGERSGAGPRPSNGLGIRGAGTRHRSGSPPDGRDNGYRRRSRSPADRNRRESYGRR